jgi:hypothetical protein
MLGVINVNKEKTPVADVPKIYDTEKIIDIHSTECDPSLDSKKVRQVKSYAPHAVPGNTSSDAGAKNENKPDASWGIPTLAKFSHVKENKNVDVYDYHGKLD